MAIKEAILNGGETINKTATTIPQDRTGEDELHDKDDTRTISVKIPTLILPNLGNFQEEENVFRVGDHPILRIVPPINNEEQDSLQRIPNQPPNINISQQDKNALPPSQEEITSENKKGQGLETAAHNENLEGWTLVTRRKKRSTPQASVHRRNQQSYMQIHATKLRQQQKCFKCLMKGHIQAACRNPRRCLHCNLTGHIVRRCPSMPEGSSRVSQGRNTSYKERSVPTKEAHFHNRRSQQHFQNPPHHQNLNRKNMEAPRNWLTMAMNEPGELWQERPHHLNVYLAPRAELSPANLFLERSAFVFAGPRRSDPYLKQRIVSCMGRQFHCDASEFGVFVIDEDFGDLLIIFPTADMAATAIDQASFYIGNNIEIALHPYSPDLQLAAAQDWIIDLKRKLVESGLLTGELQTQQGGMQGPTLLESQTVVNGNPTLALERDGDATMANRSGTGFKYRFTRTTISDGNQFITGTMAVTSHAFLPTGELKFMCFEKGMLTENLNSAEYIKETEMGYNLVYGDGVSGPKRASLQLIEEGQTSGFGIEQGQNSNLLASTLDVPTLQVLENQGADENQGPPPGFDFPTYAANSQQEQVVNETLVQQGVGIQQELNTTTQQARKSARLTEKYSGGRVRYDAGKRKYKRGNAKFKPVRLEYQDSLKPLDKEQAEKVIKMAGVQISGKIDEEVEKIVFK
ncbi:Gag polyprotein [Carex littledalei]|uniref:Gag polyprotein n=1 Tax=Carex littledalei TaxID=544730 RepID=A0A833VJX2_9POAL|nr:Gag polyprotein [Carex littledalei]